MNLVFPPCLCLGRERKDLTLLFLSMSMLWFVSAAFRGVRPSLVGVVDCSACFQVQSGVFELSCDVEMRCAAGGVAACSSDPLGLRHQSHWPQTSSYHRWGLFCLFAYLLFSM